MTEVARSWEQVDPELRSELAAIPTFDVDAGTLSGIRDALRDMLAAAPAAPTSAVERTEHWVPRAGDAPPMRLIVFRPTARAGAKAAMVHMHGGGFVMGTADMDDARNAGLAAELDLVIVSVDYRLAPESAFPDAIDDCYAALAWVHHNAAALGVEPGRIAVGGVSAGGGLAAALALLARDRGEHAVAFQLLIYPMLDDRTATADPPPHLGEFIWTPSANRFGWSSLLGGSSEASPYAAAARAERLEGLPPAAIFVGSLDLFAPENIDFARRLTLAGVPVELHVYPGAYHGFDMVEDAAVTQSFKRDYAAALRRALAPV